MAGRAGPIAGLETGDADFLPPPNDAEPVRQTTENEVVLPHGNAISNLVAFPHPSFRFSLFLPVDAQRQPLLAERGQRMAEEVHRGTYRIRVQAGSLVLSLQLGSQFGDLLLGPLDLAGPGLPDLGHVAGCVIDKGIALPPVGPALLGDPPGDRVPNKIGHLGALAVEEAD